MTNLECILKSRDITLPTKVCLVKAMVFPVVLYGCESWTIKKAECKGIDAFELWCWRRLLRVPWTARRPNQSILKKISPQFSSVQLLSHVRLFVTPWTAACQASLSIANCWSLPKLRSIELVMPFNHLILHRPLLLQTSIFPSITVFSNESALCISWTKYWSFSFNIRPSNEQPGLISVRMD